MRFGASSFIWVSPFSTDTLDLIDKVKALGFDLIEICVEDPRTIDVNRVRRRLDDVGLEVLVCGAFGPNRDMSSDDPAVRETAAGYTRRCIDIAADLGSATVSGPMYAGVGNTAMRDERDRRAQWERAVAGLKFVADHAATQNVKLAFEPLNRFETDLVNTVDQGLRLIGDIGLPNVGFLLDTFHMNIEEKSIPEAIRRAGRHIFEFHACSSDRGTPGEDHLPWPEIVAALAATGYDGPVVIEAFTPKIKEIARAVSLWRPLADSEDALAGNGLTHLRRVFAWNETVSVSASRQRGTVLAIRLLLRLIHCAGRSSTASLAVDLGIPRSSLYRITRILAETGLLDLSRRGEVALGPLALQLGKRRDLLLRGEDAARVVPRPKPLHPHRDKVESRAASCIGANHTVRAVPAFAQVQDWLRECGG